MKSLGLGRGRGVPVPRSAGAAGDRRRLRAARRSSARSTSARADGHRAQLARLPVDPRIGRMLLAAHEEGCLAEVLVIAAALSVQDPRERPLERAQAADAAQKKFADEQSDFLGYLKLWKFFEDGLHHESNRKLHQACREHFLSFNRDARMARHPRAAEGAGRRARLEGRRDQAGQRPVRAGPSRAAHRAARQRRAARTDEGSYQGARGIKFWVHPGSALGKKAPRWIMAAELIETTRLFARTVAGIEPEWLERLGAHLLKRSQTDPHWEKQARAGRGAASAARSTGCRCTSTGACTTARSTRRSRGRSSSARRSSRATATRARRSSRTTGGSCARSRRSSTSRAGPTCWWTTS